MHTGSTSQLLFSLTRTPVCSVSLHRRQTSRNSWTAYAASTNDTSTVQIICANLLWRAAQIQWWRTPLPWLLLRPRRLSDLQTIAMAVLSSVQACKHVHTNCASAAPCRSDKRSCCLLSSVRQQFRCLLVQSCAAVSATLDLAHAPTTPDSLPHIALQQLEPVGKRLVVVLVILPDDGVPVPLS